MIRRAFGTPHRSGLMSPLGRLGDFLPRRPCRRGTAGCSFDYEHRPASMSLTFSLFLSLSPTLTPTPTLSPLSFSSVFLFSLRFTSLPLSLSLSLFPRSFSPLGRRQSPPVYIGTIHCGRVLYHHSLSLWSVPLLSSQQCRRHVGPILQGSTGVPYIREILDNGRRSRWPRKFSGRL